MSCHERIGFCIYCLQPIEAVLPHGRDVRHVADGIPYGACIQGRRETLRRLAEERSRSLGLPFIVLDPEVAA